MCVVLFTKCSKGETSYPRTEDVKRYKRNKSPRPLQKKGGVGGGGMTDLKKRIRVELFASDENKRIINLPYLNMLW